MRLTREHSNAGRSAPAGAWQAGVAAALSATAFLALGTTLASARPHGGTPTARNARSAKVDDRASMHLLKASGSVLIEEGPATGTLPGRTKVRLVVGSSVQASFTIWVKGGSIEGHGGAALHSSSRYASFGGWLSVTGGSGRYAHAHGSGRLYGVLDRRTHALQVQTIGTLGY
jgi:hypothetical protein